MRGEAGEPFGVELGLQEGGVVGLAPDRVGADLRAEMARHGRHEFPEVLAVGPRDVWRFQVRGRPARHRRGDRQQHLPAEPLGFREDRVVQAPVVARGVGRVEGRARWRWWRRGRPGPSTARPAGRARRGGASVRRPSRGSRGSAAWSRPRSTRSRRGRRPRARLRRARTALRAAVGGGASNALAWCLVTPRRRQGCGLCSVPVSHGYPGSPRRHRPDP